jgi:hypothetical protein
MIPLSALDETSRLCSKRRGRMMLRLFSTVSGFASVLITNLRNIAGLYPRLISAGLIEVENEP